MWNILKLDVIDQLDNVRLSNLRSYQATTPILETKVYQQDHLELQPSGDEDTLGMIAGIHGSPDGNEQCNSHRNLLSTF